MKEERMWFFLVYDVMLYICLYPPIIYKFNLFFLVLHKKKPTPAGNRFLWQENINNRILRSIFCFCFLRVYNKKVTNQYEADTPFLQ